MNIRTLVLPTLLSFALLNSPILLAGPVNTMADILMHLHHHPSASEKTTLQNIANDNSATENERVMANILINLNHRPSADDKEKLNKIMNDKSASSNEREMASIIYNLNHKPTSEDQDKLRQMM